MIRKYICPLVVAIISLIASNSLQAVEIKEKFILTPEGAIIQNDINDNYSNAGNKTGTKGDFEILGTWLSPRDTIFTSNGYILYWIDIHDAKYYNKFLWDYFYPILSPETGIPTSVYDTLFMPWFVHLPPSLTYMPPDSSNSNPYYWQPYWRFWWVNEQTDYFNPDSCWSFGVGFSFLDMNTYYRDPGVWKTEVNMTTETNTTPNLLCDTLFYVIDDIPPYAIISNLQDSGVVGDTYTVQVSGGDNAFVEKTELYIDDNLVKSAYGGGLEYLWTVPQDEEIHVLQAKVYDVYNPPLQLGLSGTSKPIHVSRTNVQATEIVASNNVKLYQFQNDTIFQGHFVSLFDLTIDKQIPVGAVINASKYLLFQLNLKLECYNFGQPSTWQPVCKYSLDLSEFGGTEAKGEFIGWNGSILVNKELKNVSEKSFGEHDLLLELKFEDQNGNLISGANIPMKCWVFFHKYSQWKEDNTATEWVATYPWGTSYPPIAGVSVQKRGIVPNGYYFWKRVESFEQTIQIQTKSSFFVPNSPFSILGFYQPWFKNGDDNYFVLKEANEVVLLVDQSGNPVNVFYGVDAFSITCRHENTHKTLFLQWWGTWDNYYKTWQTADPDRDFVPSNIELQFGLDPTNPNSRPPINTINNFTDFEYIVYLQHSGWASGLWDSADWASPGKQTYPKF